MEGTPAKPYRPSKATIARLFGTNVLLVFAAAVYDHWGSPPDIAFGMVLSLCPLTGIVVLLAMAHVALAGFRAPRALWVAVLLLPGVGLMVYEVVITLPCVQVRWMLRAARFPELPPSAIHLRVADWSGLWTGESHIMFQAPQAEIEAFISASPALRGRRPEQFDADRMLLPRAVGSPRDWEPDDPHEYCSMGPCTPDWYRPTIRVRGRRWEVSKGYVIVNDENGTVYIHLVWG